MSLRETVSLAVGDAQAPNKTAIKTVTRPMIECLILRVIYPPFLFDCEVFQQVSDVRFEVSGSSYKLKTEN
jgi:hypothetical protein